MTRPPSWTGCSVRCPTGAAGETTTSAGALHHLTAEHRVAAAALVRTGQTISLARNLATTPSPENPYPAHHHMLAAGDARDSNGIPGYEAAATTSGPTCTVSA